MTNWGRWGRVVGTNRATRRRRGRARATQLETLETRICPSNMTWVNRGQASDNFGTVFGANAEAARGVVDSVLQAWGTVIQNLNQPALNAPADRNTINFTISMDVSRTGFGGGANITDYAYPSEDDRTAGRNGYPVAGTITLDQGQPGRPNNGFWIDPTPQDSVEFTDILSPSAARPGPAVVGNDIYSTINAEIVHILGLFSPPTQLQTPLNGSVITKLDTRDPQGNGTGFYYVFDGPSGTHLLTSYDSGGGGTDTGSSTHTASAEANNYPVAFTSKFRGAVQLRGGLDAGNATGGDARILPSDNVANLLKDAYNYTVQLPSTVPGLTYNVGVAGRTLRINGGPDGIGGATPAPTGSATSAADGHAHHGAGPNFVDDGGNSADSISLRREGDFLVVSLNLGRTGPVENSNPHDGSNLVYETRVPLSSFDAIQIDDGAGDDSLTYDFSGGEFLPSGGISENGGNGTDTVRVKLGTTAAGTQAFVYRSTSSSSAVITLLPPSGSPPGSLPETMTLTDVSSVILDGGAASGAATTLYVDELVSTGSATVPTNLPTLLPTTQQGFQAVTLLTADPTKLLRLYNPGNDAHFFTTAVGEYINAIASGFRDETGNPVSAFSVSPIAAPGAVPVFRLYNVQSGIHYLTTNAGERDQLVGLVPPNDPNFGKSGWREETAQGFVFPTPMPGTVEVFHLYHASNGSHLFTANASEVVGVLSQFPNEWKLNRSLGFAYPAGLRASRPPVSARALSAGAIAEETTSVDSESNASLDNLAGLIAVPSAAVTTSASVSTSESENGGSRVSAAKSAPAIQPPDADALGEFFADTWLHVMDE